MRWLTTRLAAVTVLAGTTAAVNAQKPVAPAPAAPSMPAPGSPGVEVRRGPDADTIWGFMSQGQGDTIDLNKRPDLKAQMERRGTPIPADGILRKAQFKADYEKRMAERSSRGGRPGGMPDGAPPVMVEAPPQPVFVPPQPEQPQPQPGPGGSPGGRKKDDAPDKPFVSRFGNLPKEAPSFFVEFDDDEDGMIGLYEWRRHKKPISEFVPMDLNGDGLLTPDEHLRFRNAEIAKTPDGKGKDTASRDRRETRSGKTADARGKDGTPARATTPGGERPSRGQRPDDKSADRPAAPAPRNPFTGK